VTTEDGVGIESQKMLVPKGPKGVGWNWIEWQSGGYCFVTY
jgi:hypothetical protein